MTTTDKIMVLVSNYSTDFANGFPGEFVAYNALRTEIETLVRERDALLEALREFIDATEGVIFEGGIVTIDNTSSGWFDRARAAVAKATGETK